MLSEGEVVAIYCYIYPLMWMYGFPQIIPGDILLFAPVEWWSDMIIKFVVFINSFNLSEGIELDVLSLTEAQLFLMIMANLSNPNDRAAAYAQIESFYPIEAQEGGGEPDMFDNMFKRKSLRGGMRGAKPTATKAVAAAAAAADANRSVEIEKNAALRALAERMGVSVAGLGAALAQTAAAEKAAAARPNYNPFDDDYDEQAAAVGTSAAPAALSAARAAEATAGNVVAVGASAAGQPAASVITYQGTVANQVQHLLQRAQVGKEYDTDNIAKALNAVKDSLAKDFNTIGKLLPLISDPKKKTITNIGKINPTLTENGKKIVNFLFGIKGKLISLETGGNVIKREQQKLIKAHRNTRNTVVLATCVVALSGIAYYLYKNYQIQVATAEEEAARAAAAAAAAEAAAAAAAEGAAAAALASKALLERATAGVAAGVANGMNFLGYVWSSIPSASNAASFVASLPAKAGQLVAKTTVKAAVGATKGAVQGAVESALPTFLRENLAPLAVAGVTGGATFATGSIAKAYLESSSDMRAAVNEHERILGQMYGLLLQTYFNMFKKEVNILIEITRNAGDPRFTALAAQVFSMHGGVEKYIEHQVEAWFNKILTKSGVEITSALDTEAYKQFKLALVNYREQAVNEIKVAAAQYEGSIQTLKNVSGNLIKKSMKIGTMAPMFAMHAANAGRQIALTAYTGGASALPAIASAVGGAAGAATKAFAGAVGVVAGASKTIGTGVPRVVQAPLASAASTGLLMSGASAAAGAGQASIQRRLTADERGQAAMQQARLLQGLMAQPAMAQALLAQTARAQAPESSVRIERLNEEEAARQLLLGNRSNEEYAVNAMLGLGTRGGRRLRRTMKHKRKARKYSTRRNLKRKY